MRTDGKRRRTRATERRLRRRLSSRPNREPYDANVFALSPPARLRRKLNGTAVPASGAAVAAAAAKAKTKSGARAAFASSQKR